MELSAFGIWWSGWRTEDGLEDVLGQMEAAGYGAVWLSGGFQPGLMPRFGQLLGASPTMIVASGIVNTWLTPAADLALAVARLDEEHPGRFLLGLGASHAPIVENSGQAYERPLSQVRHFLDELDAAEPTVAKERRVLAALGPRMLELAGERALGAHPYFSTVEHTAFARGVLGEGPLLAPEVAVVMSAEASVARERARGYMAMYLTLPNYVSNLLRTGWTEDDVADGGSDRLVDALVPWGSAHAVAERLREHREAGADHVCVQVVGGDGMFPTEEYAELAGALALA